MYVQGGRGGTVTMVALGGGKRRSLLSEARGGLERDVTGRCREAYRAKASLEWTSAR